jgi:beta-phosphoglucomutase
MKTKVKAGLWDMDGVIVDSGHFHYLSWQFAFKKPGIHFTEEDFQRIFGQRNDAIVRKIMRANVGQALIDRIAEDKEEYFRQALEGKLKPFPGVIELLNTLKKMVFAQPLDPQPLWKIFI